LRRPVGSADVAKLVDALDLGSSDFGRGGSSPFIRTTPPSTGGATGRAQCAAHFTEETNEQE
jgi:hypothetical protein